MHRTVGSLLGIGLVLTSLFAVPTSTAVADETSSPPTPSTATSTPTPPATPSDSGASTAASPTTPTPPASPAPTTPTSPSTTPGSTTPPPPPSTTSTTPSAPATTAESPIARRYRESGGADGPLGRQLTAETAISGGQMATYERGQIRWSAATGARIIEPDVVEQLDTRLGFPTAEIVCHLANGGCRQDFQGGVVTRDASAGTHPVLGDIGKRYAGLNYQAGHLGYPTGAERCTIKDNGCYQKFQGGTMYWSSGTGAQPVWGAILKHFAWLNHERGQLGLPTSGERCDLRAKGCLQRFQGGVVYWSPTTGAHAVWGGIRTRWAGLGWENGQLGYPIGNEGCGLRDKGCYQKFEGGIMYWSHASGAHPTWGAILTRYSALKFERSPLGYPTSGESCRSATTCTQTYQFGQITWNSGKGAHETYLINARIRATTAADVKYTYRSGCPVGASGLRTIEMNYWGFDGLIHRGVLIVKTSLAKEVLAAFTDSFKARWRLQRMTNPNEWKGDDPTQMAANNTSGFNCRTVVGNPYAMSPHSYGIAIDSNTVQNPYRDRNGKWWPSNGRDYILGAGLNRKVTHFAVMTTSSPFTKALESRGWFWGGRWNPGRDYQHFEKR